MFAGGGMRSLQSALFSQVQARRPREAGPLNEQHCGEPVSSSTSVAVSTTHQAADLGAQRIVTLRVFDGNIHRLGLLSLCEAAGAIVGLYPAIFIRFAAPPPLRWRGGRPPPAPSPPPFPPGPPPPPRPSPFPRLRGAFWGRPRSRSP